MLRPLLTLVLLLAPALAHAGGIVVFPPSATNITPPEAMAAGSLMADAFRNASGQKVIGPQEAQQAMAGQSPEQVTQSLGCEWYVESSLVRLDRTGQLSADLVNANDGQRRHRQIPLGSLDDMSPASTRIAQALWKNEPDHRNRKHRHRHRPRLAADQAPAD